MDLVWVMPKSCKLVVTDLSKSDGIDNGLLGVDDPIVIFSFPPGYNLE
ncbi:23598_t:CDS:2 [Entrophospora sp. SA101]|nr:23598_t:CDS:2 [Entrophospora sp. SA101]